MVHKLPFVRHHGPLVHFFTKKYSFYSKYLTPVSDSEEDLLEVANSEVLKQTNAKLIQESKNPFTPGKLYQRKSSKAYMI